VIRPPSAAEKQDPQAEAIVLASTSKTRRKRRIAEPGSVNSAVEVLPWRFLLRVVF